MVNILGVTLIDFFFMYYRVYTLKHCEIILLHSKLYTRKTEPRVHSNAQARMAHK